MLDGAHEADPQAPKQDKQDRAFRSPKQRYKHSQEPEADGAGSSDEAEHEHEQEKLTAAWLKRLSVSATKLTKNYKKDDAVARNILRQSVHQRLENAMVHMQTAKEMWQYLEPAVQMNPSDYMHRVQEEIAVHLYSDPMQMCDAMQELLTVARMNPTVGELRWAEQLLMGAAMASCPVDRYWGFELIWKTIPQEKQTVERFAQQFQYFLTQEKLRSKHSSRANRSGAAYSAGVPARRHCDNCGKDGHDTDYCWGTSKQRGKGGAKVSRSGQRPRWQRQWQSSKRQRQGQPPEQARRRPAGPGRSRQQAKKCVRLFHVGRSGA